MYSHLLGGGSYLKLVTFKDLSGSHCDMKGMSCLLGEYFKSSLL